MNAIQQIADAWPLEARQADCRKFLDHAHAHARLSGVKPGYTAGTYGLTKAWVCAEIRARCELGGDFGK